MKTCLIQPRLEYFIVSSLIFLLPGGATPPEVMINRYEGPDRVFEGTRINFTGTVESPGSYPKGYSFSIKPVNATSYKVCNIYFGECNETFDYTCYCSRKDGDTYYFVVHIVATLERSEATITANVGGIPGKYPIVIVQTTTISTTTTTVPTTTTTFTTPIRTTTTTTTTTTRATTKEAAQRSFIEGKEQNKTDAIVIAVCSVGILALIGMILFLVFMNKIDTQE